MIKKYVMYCLVSMLVVLLLFTGCSNGPEGPNGSEELEKTTVILDWTPNTNHTGLYVALKNGYYEEEGLDVEIVQPMEGSSTTLVAAGQGDFGVTYQEDVTYARTGKDPLPVIAIATIIQDNTSGFAWRKEENIQTVKDFEGKVYGGWGSPSEEAILEAIMTSAGADYTKLRNVNIGADDFFAATDKDIDIVWIFEGWTGLEAELRGVELDYMPLKDLHEDLNYYTPVLVTNTALRDSDPEKVRRFLKATERGYRYAMDDPEAAAAILLEYAPELDQDLVVESQKFLAGEYKGEAPQWGLMEEEVWQNYADFLQGYGLLEKELDVENAYTNEFLPQ
ncbi:ABC transporter substrate-binding protein [Alkalibacter rhizosphaerae]|uniref:ABC transporter substrate-binding protein n=1 Tax=Alkalibacter rhizosphaerae TaxID=2815577 RepID=A0A974XI82_9FIRM|nr:ABC transporter substrate-binding protein [Alkalibacter rhizosphaerae]QSX08838.1 ABC transporter substrate-binding protein [Alkalibacter rhizosphaerae]